MGLFDWFRTRADDGEDNRLLRERVRDLESDYAALRREWIATREEHTRLLAKIARRANREAEAVTESLQDAPGSTIANGEVLHPAEVFRRNQVARRRG